MQILGIASVLVGRHNADKLPLQVVYFHGVNCYY